MHGFCVSCNSTFITLSKYDFKTANILHEYELNRFRFKIAQPIFGKTYKCTDSIYDLG